MGWAQIFLYERTGSLSIISDYDNWGYRWSHIGTRSLKEFLVEADPDYVLRKLCHKRELDFDATEAALLKGVVEEFEAGRNTAADRDRAHKLIQQEMMHTCNAMELYRQLEDERILRYLRKDFDPSEDFVYGPNFQVKLFMTNLWPLFIADLKQELRRVKVRVGISRRWSLYRGTNERRACFIQ